MRKMFDSLSTLTLTDAECDGPPGQNRKADGRKGMTVLIPGHELIDRFKTGFDIKQQARSQLFTGGGGGSAYFTGPLL